MLFITVSDDKGLYRFAVHQQLQLMGGYRLISDLVLVFTNQRLTRLGKIAGDQLNLNRLLTDF